MSLVNKLFNKYIYNQSAKHWTIFGGLFLASFVVFRVLSIQDKNVLESSISSILRNEYTSSNSYALTKGLTDLEVLGIVKCFTLVEQGATDQIYADTTMAHDCAEKQSEIKISTINGKQYIVYFVPSTNRILIFLELTVYLSLIVVSFVVDRQRQAEVRIAQERMERYLKMLWTEGHEAAAS